MGKISFPALFLALLIYGCMPKSSYSHKAGTFGIQTSSSSSNSSSSSSSSNPSNASGVTVTGSTSPSGSSNLTPKIYGTVRDTSIGYVYLYKRSTVSGVATNCGTLIAEGTVDEFSEESLGDVDGPGLQITSLTPNSEISIYAKSAASKLSQPSACSPKLYTYRHVNIGPVKMTRLTPNSPSRTTSAPTVIGTISDSAITTLNFFDSAGCEIDHLRKGNVPASQFKGSGVELTLDPNKTTSVYVVPEGPSYSSSEEECWFLFNYQHDDLGPPISGKLRHSLYSTSLNQSPVITWDAPSADPSGVKEYLYEISNEAGDILKTGSISTNSLTVTGLNNTSPKLEEGLRYLATVRAKDNLGNISANAITSDGWIVDTTPPLFSISEPHGTDVIAGRSVEVNGTCINNLPITISALSGVTLPSAPICNNEFYSFVAQLTGVTGSRTITVTQSNGTNLVNLSVTFTYQPLSSFGSTIAAGNSHTCATKSGRSYCWGNGENGRLGTGASPTSQNVPDEIPPGGLTATYEYITSGANHTCTLRSNKSAYCWGENAGTALQVGQPSKGNFDYPKQILKSGANINFTQISAGAFHTCGIDETNKIYCWGMNNFRQLGNGAGTEKFNASPARIDLGFSSPGVSRIPTQISSGGYYSCALTSLGKIFCWGRNKNGELGYGQPVTKDMSADPLEVSSYPLNGTEKYTYVSAGAYHACAVTNQNRVFCWGHNVAGALGTGNVTQLLKPTEPALPNGSVVNFAKVFAGGDITTLANQSTCALTTNGKLYCWGSDKYGQKGDGSAVPDLKNSATLKPALIGEASLTFTEVSVGGVHACAKTSTDAIYCWGLKDNGRLGIGDYVKKATAIVPTLVTSWP